MIYLYLFGTCFHFIYVFMIIGKYYGISWKDKYLLADYEAYYPTHY